MTISLLNVCLVRFFLAATGRISISAYRLARAARTDLLALGGI